MGATLYNTCLLAGVFLISRRDAKMWVMQYSLSRQMILVVFKAAVVLVTIILSVISIGTLYELDEGVSDGRCNVAVLPVEGVVLPYSGLIDVPLVVTPGTVADYLMLAEEDTGIEAVLLEINSPGGTPVASERIAERLRASTLPVVGLVGDQSASGGYMIAAATDYLLASAMSDIGSIGVDMSYVEESERNEEEGLTYVQLTTGKFKDIGSPNRPITAEERALLERDLKIVNDHFIDLISLYRGLEREAVVALADGATMPGALAVENGLVDSIGGRSEARQAIATILDKDPSQVEFCEYEVPIFPI